MAGIISVESYFGILEDLRIGFRLPVFSKRAKRRLVAHPKFCFFDAGVFRALRPKGPLDKPEEIDGSACETLLFQELLATNDALDLFEVKRTARASGIQLRGLRAFLKRLSDAESLFPPRRQAPDTRGSN